MRLGRLLLTTCNAARFERRVDRTITTNRKGRTYRGRGIRIRTRAIVVAWRDPNTPSRLPRFLSTTSTWEARS